MKDIKLLGSSSGEYIGDNNDISFDTTNDIAVIDGPTRIKQALVKIFLTKLYSSDIYQGYGSGLPDLVFRSIIDPRVDEVIRNLVIETLIYLINIEPSEVANERIVQVNSIDIIPVTEGDITRFFIKISVTLETKEIITLTLGD